MKKAASVIMALLMIVALGLTVQSLFEARTQRENARDIADKLTQMQDAYSAASERAEALESENAALRAQIEQLTAEPTPTPAPPVDADGTRQMSREEADALAAQNKASYGTGARIGRIRVEGTALDCGLFWGDTEGILNSGGGCANYEGCVLPGENGTVFIGGHTGSFFSDLKSAEVGSIIHLETPWGDFRYKISETRVINETDIDACHWGETKPLCILYTCYPFGILQHTPYRYLTYAEPVAADEQGVLPYTLADS